MVRLKGAGHCPQNLRPICSFFNLACFSAEYKMTAKDQSKYTDKHLSPVVSRLEVRLSIKDKIFRQEFDEFLDIELISIIDRLTLKLGSRLPSITHNLVKNKENYAIILSVTNGFQVASYLIEINASECSFLLKNDSQVIKIHTSITLGEVLEGFLLNRFGNSENNFISKSPTCQAEKDHLLNQT